MIAFSTGGFGHAGFIALTVLATLSGTGSALRDFSFADAREGTRPCRHCHHARHLNSSLLDRAERLDFRRLSEKHVDMQRKSALSFHEAERKIMSAFGGRGPKGKKSFMHSDLSSFSGSSTLKNAQSSLMACITVEVDLTAAGCPLCVVSVGLSGELASDTCSMCYRWRLEAVLGFSISVRLLGIGLWFGVEVKGRIETEEVPCLMAKDSDYCAIADIFFDDESKLDDGMWHGRCHSSSPFSLIMAYIEVQLKHVRQALSKAIGEGKMAGALKGLTFEGELAKTLAKAEELESYPSLIVETPLADSNSGEDSSYVQLLNTDCQGGEELDVHRYVGLAYCKRACARDRTCTAIVIGQKGTQHAGTCWLRSDIVWSRQDAIPATCVHSEVRDTYILQSRGDAANLESEDSSRLEGWFSIRAVRAVLDGDSVPTPYVSLTISRRNIKLVEWASSYVLHSPMPTWDEATGLMVNLQDGPNLHVEVRVLDTTSRVSEKELGRLDLSVEIPRLVSSSNSDAASKESCRFPCRRYFTLLQSAQRSGRLELEIHWLPRPTLHTDMSLNERAVTAMWSAYDSFSAKLPRYSQQVLSLLHSPVHPSHRKTDRSIFAEAISGRGFARWPFEGTTEASSAKAAHRRRRLHCSSAKNDAAKGHGTRALNVVQVLREIEGENRDRLLVMKVKSARALSGPHGEAPNRPYVTAELEEGNQVEITGSPDGHLEQSRKNPLWIMNDRHFKVTSTGILTLRVFDGEFELGSALLQVSQLQMNRKRELKLQLQRSATSEGAAWALEQEIAVEAELLEEHEEDRVDKYVEAAVSTANIFLRAVSDIHAMFGIYFADDPHWTGECTALPPSFHSMYEDTPTTGWDVLVGKGAAIQRVVDRDSRAQDTTNRRVPNKRALKTSIAKGKLLAGDKNPWCSREWLSGSSLLAEQLDFAVRDAPSRAKDGAQTPTGEHGGKIYAQLWCEAARQWRLLPPSARGYQRRSYLEESFGDEAEQGAKSFMKDAEDWDDSDEGEGTVLGRGLRFDNGCRRLVAQHVEGEAEDHYVWEHRADCEMVHLSPAFMTIFPQFFAQIRLHFDRIGEHLEHSLGCLETQIPPSLRQFRPSEDVQTLAPACNANGANRTAISRKRLVAIIHEVRAFVLRLGAQSQALSTEQEQQLEHLKDWADQLQRNQPEQSSEVVAGEHSLLERSGLERHIVEQFAKHTATSGETEDLNAFMQQTERTLLQPPWSKTIPDILAAVSSIQDVGNLCRYVTMKGAVKKVLQLPFVDEDACEHEKDETKIESLPTLRRCWGLSPMELEGAYVRAFLARLQARTKPSVRTAEHDLTVNFAQTQNLENAVAQTRPFVAATSDAGGVWFASEGLVLIRKKGDRDPRHLQGPFVRHLVRLVWGSPFESPELQLVDASLFSRLAWTFDVHACQEINAQFREETCQRIQIPTKEKPFMFDHELANWPPDVVGASIPRGLEKRAVRLATRQSEVFVLPEARSPAATHFRLTLQEQIMANALEGSALLSEVQELMASRRPKHHRASQVPHGKALLKYSSGDWFSSSSEALAAASHLQSRRTLLEKMLMADAGLDRPDMRKRLIAESQTNRYMATWDNSRLTVAAIEHGFSKAYLVSGAEARRLFIAGTDERVTLLAQSPIVGQVRKSIVDAVLEHNTPYRKQQVLDDRSFVAFTGRAYVAMDKHEEQRSCCCKSVSSNDQCSNLAARVSKAFGGKQGLVCCKWQKHQSGCPSFSGYSQYTTEPERCLPFTGDLLMQKNALQDVVRNVRFVKTPHSASLQFLNDALQTDDVVDWEMSPRACDSLDGCQRIELACRGKVSVWAGTAQVGNQSDLPLISVRSDAVLARLVPIDEGHFVDARYAQENRRAAMEGWLKNLRDFPREQDESEMRLNMACSPDNRKRPVPLNREQVRKIQEASTDQVGAAAMEVADEILAAAQDARDKELRSKRPIALAIIANELRWSVASLKVFSDDHIHGGLRASADTVSPFDVASDTNTQKLGGCCALGEASCPVTEELLPLRCTVLHMQRARGDLAPHSRDGRAQQEAGIWANKALSLGSVSWNLIAALDGDFHIAFAYYRPQSGPLLLTGLLWSALPHVRRVYSKQESLQERQKSLKRHLAWAVRREQIATGGKKAKLPYPPIKYESSIEFRVIGGISFGVFTGVTNACQPPAGFSFAIARRTGGRSWNDAETTENCLIAQGTVPVITTVIRIERCWHEAVDPSRTNSEGKAETEAFDLWRIDLMSFVLDRDSILKESGKEIYKFLKGLTWGALTPSTLQSAPLGLAFKDGKADSAQSMASSIMQVSVTSLAMEIISNPAAFLGSLAGGALGGLAFVARAAASVLGEVTKTISKWAVEWAAKTGFDKLTSSVTGALNAGWDWVKQHVGVDSRERHAVRASLTLSRAIEGRAMEGAWTKEYSLHYLKYNTLEMRVTVPGIVRVQALMVYVAAMDLSYILTWLFSKMEGDSKGTRFKHCLACLSCGRLECESGGSSSQSHAFCADKRYEVQETASNGTDKKELVWADECMPAANADMRCGSREYTELIDDMEECASVIDKD
eukprot:TRINITY_DN18392_c0_g1_i1.p1 TRINITY_DN18392_c0_g1~~TRINITY_DN18392_c0_g1_i1.p1  ORF type:complete len:2560 (+),score=458.57 TRINITY_DN18392_c0_g1_i1:60-7739(+)